MGRAIMGGGGGGIASADGEAGFCVDWDGCDGRVAGGAREAGPLEGCDARGAPDAGVALEVLASWRSSGSSDESLISPRCLADSSSASLRSSALVFFLFRFRCRLLPSP